MLTLTNNATSTQNATSTAVNLLLQAASAVVLVSAGFVVPLPSVFGEWQQAAQFALSLVWILGAIQAVQFLGRTHRMAATHGAHARIHHRRNDRRTGKSTRLAG